MSSGPKGSKDSLHPQRLQHAVIRRRFPKADAGLEADLAACEEAAWGETINPRQALKLIQTLHSHRVALAAAKLRGLAQPNLQSNPQERAS